VTLLRVREVTKRFVTRGQGGLLAPKTAFTAVDRVSFDESFPLLARADFGRALRLAQSIKATDAAMLAQVAACRGILVRQ
jgi:ABC-type antimicrobial peptide transport system ATPase subunit